MLPALQIISALHTSSNTDRYTSSTADGYTSTPSAAAGMADDSYSAVSASAVETADTACALVASILSRDLTLAQRRQELDRSRKALQESEQQQHRQQQQQQQQQQGGSSFVIQEAVIAQESSTTGTSGSATGVEGSMLAALQEAAEVCYN